MRRFNLGSTLSLNPFNYYIIKENHENEDTLKKVLFIGARVHPGETMSSHVMEKLILDLTNPD